MKDFAQVKEELKNEKPKLAYGAPGAIMKTSDGRLYQVHADGSWRRYYGGPAAATEKK